MSGIELLKSKKTLLIKLCKEFKVLNLDIFGSGTSTRYQPGISDLDFLVEFKSMPPIEHADCFFGLLEALRKLFNCSIDLVEVKAIKNPYFVKSSEKTRQRIYAA